VGSLIVVNPDEIIEAFLLLQEIERGGLGGFFFQSQMHAFVTPVLLGMAWLALNERFHNPRKRTRLEMFKRKNLLLTQPFMILG
jgi:hypothetical protein